MNENIEENSTLQYRMEYAQKWNSVSAEIPDKDREKSKKSWDPGRKLLAAIRSYQYWVKKHGLTPFLMKKQAILRYRYWSIASGAEIPLNTQIGEGLLIPHPNGIVIHQKSIIGINCLLFQQVTLGKGGKKPGLPILGGHVDIGAGAKILGGVRIGNHVRIGANAVVLDDVPDNSIAVGIPARIISISE